MRANPSQPAKLRKLLAELCHDVGKYVARTAHNLPERLNESLAPELLHLLVQDLYGGHGDGPRPSARFQCLFTQLRQEHPELADPRFSLVEESLRTIDSLEARVTSGEHSAIEQAASLGRTVDKLLRESARAATLLSSKGMS